MNTFFQNKFRETSRLDDAYEWLPMRGIIEQLSSPVKLTLKSQVEMEEATYYYDQEEAISFSEWGTAQSREEIHQHIIDAMDAFVDKVKGD